jgi:autotransporter-associated beta strand protein
MTLNAKIVYGGMLAILSCLVMPGRVLADPPVFKAGVNLVNLPGHVVNGRYDFAGGDWGAGSGALRSDKKLVVSPEVADWNNDGLMDLIVGQSDGRIRLFLNRGTQSCPVFRDFEYLKTNDGKEIWSWPGACICYGGNPECPVPRVVDWNNDGRKDLVLGQWGAFAGSYLYSDVPTTVTGSYYYVARSGVFVYLNKGTDRAPVLERKLGCSSTASSPAVMSMPFVTDLTGDGFPDLISGDDFTQIWVYNSDWTREMRTPSSSLKIYSGKRKNLFPIGSITSFWRNYEMYHFDVSPYTDSFQTTPQDVSAACPAGSCKSVVAADWTGRGLKDLVVGMQDGTVWYAANTGTTNAPAFASYSALQAGGANLVVGDVSKVGMVTNIGASASGYPYLVPINEARLAVGDLDGDGLPDLVAGCSDGSISVYYQSNPTPVAMGQQVLVTPNTSKAITLTARVDSGNPVTFTRLSDPVHGTLTGSSSNLVYTPDTGYLGADSFTYQASAGTVTSLVATVNIIVKAHAPAVSQWISPATLSSTAIMNMNTSLDIALGATDDGNEPLTYTVVTPPAHGSHSLTNGVVTYIPATGYAGPDSFTYKANDGYGDSAVVPVNIDVCVRAVNFQPKSAPVPAGYLADTGAVYSASRGYGWNSNCVNAMVVLGGNPDLRMDTFIFRTPATTWTCDLPSNGTYHVSLGYGFWYDGRSPWGGVGHTVNYQDILTIQGNCVVSNTAADNEANFLGAGAFAVVTNGQLTVTIGGGTNNVPTRLAYVEVRTAAPLATATFVGVDSLTQGSWKGKYGADGYEIITGVLNPMMIDRQTMWIRTDDQSFNQLNNYPAYVHCNSSGGGLLPWAFPTSDPRALQYPYFDDDRRIAAATLRSEYPVRTHDLYFTDGQTHRVAQYLLGTGIVQFDVLDAISGTLLDTRTAPSCVNGKWLIWDLKGHVTIRKTLVSGNAYDCGLFFGGGAGAPSILVQPLDAKGPPGAPATFSIVANGGICSYQWQRFNNGGLIWADIAGACADSTTITNALEDNAAQFRCVVSNACGVALSGAAILTVSNALPAKPVITSPLEVSAVFNQPSFTYQIKASNNPTFFNAYLPFDFNILINTTSGLISDSSISYVQGSGVSYAEKTGDLLIKIFAGNAAGEDAQMLVVHINPTNAPVVSSALVATGMVGQAFTYTIAATNVAATSYSATGLPDGLTVNAASGVIAGTPTPAATGTTRVKLGAKNANGTGLAYLYLTIQGAPAITGQPADLAVAVGQPASFTVTATGDAPLSYQWLLNGTNITGATNAAFTSPTVGLGDAGVYSVVVSNRYNTVTSSNATLMVTASPTAPVITAHPADKSVAVGQSASFSVMATGTAALNYQWMLNGTNITGATNATLTLSTTATADAGTYGVRVTNSAGNATSSNAVLVVSDVGWGWWKLDACGGTYALDSSGGGNDGTVQGVPAWTNGVGWTNGSIQGALVLDGASNYLSTVKSNVNPNVFTLALWFRTTSTHGGRLLGFSLTRTGASSNSADRCIDMSPAGQVRFVVNPGTPQTLMSPGAYNDGQWHHAAATLSGDGMALYIDGRLVAGNASVTNGANKTGYWRVGYDYDAWYGCDMYFQGLVDDVRVHGRALSAAEILGLAAGSGSLAASHVPQAITFPNPGTHFASDVVTLGASASSGLPVSYSVVSGPATLGVGNTLAFTGAGWVTVVADQPGDGLWLAASAATNTFAVVNPTVAWGVDADGLWSVSNNWLGSVAPSGMATPVYFTNAITAGRTVTADTMPGTIGSMVFAGTGSNGWTLAGNPMTISDVMVPSIAVNAGTATVATALTSSLGLAKTGAGTLILSNANNWGGDVAVNAGTLAVAANGALGGAGSLLIGTNATLGFTGPTGSVWQIPNPITLAAGGMTPTYTISHLFSNQNSTFSGNITVADPVAGGTLALAAANDVSGSMVFSNSTVNLGNKQLLIQSGMYLANKVRFAGSTLTVTGITASAAAHHVYLWFDGGTATVSGTITAPASNGNYDRFIYLTNNASLTVDGFLMTVRSDVRLSGGSLATRQVTLSPKYNGIYLNGTWIRPMVDNTDFFNHVGSGALAGTPYSYVYVQGGGARFDVSNHNVMIRSPLLGSAGDGGLTKLGTGMLTISASRTYNGATVVSNGTLAIDFGLQAGSDYNLVYGHASRQPTNTASSLLLAGGNLTVNGRANAAAASGTWTVFVTNSAWYAAGGDTTGLMAGQGVGVNGSNLFVESVINGSNFWFSGNPGTNSGVQALTFSNETFATLQTFTNATLAADAMVTVNARGNGTTLRFLNLGGTGTLTKAGSGTLLLAGTNTAFAGAVRVQEGAMVLTNAANLAAGVTNITVATGAVLDVSGRTNGTWTLLASQTLSGGGQVVGACVNNGTIVPAGTALIVQGAFTNNGCLTIRPTGPGTAGTLAVSGTAKLGGTLKLDAGAYVPTTGDQFTALTAAGLSGFFAATNLPALADGLGWQVDCQSTAVVLRVTGTVCATNDTYGAWVRNNGNNFGGQTNLFDDPGNRGLPNLARYAFGGSATSGTEVAILEPAVDSTSRWFEVRFQRNYKAKDISYYVEDTAELGGLNGWNCVLSNILGSAWLGSAPCEETGFSNGVSTVDVTCTNVSTPTRFIRVRVTNP